MQNKEHVRKLLAERQPVLAAVLRAVERQIDQELSDGADLGPARPCGWRCKVNTAWLYHPDGSVCVDHWSCQEQDHTNIPPRCGARAADEPIGCELPKGHPGPHLHIADRPRRVAGNGSGTVTGIAGRQGHPAAVRPGLAS
jgi:hypothetical protein